MPRADSRQGKIPENRALVQARKLILLVFMETVFETRPRILIADDQPAILESLKLLLTRAKFEVDTANAAEGVVDALQRRPYDLVLMDMNYSGGITEGHEGLQLLARIRMINDDVPVVVMTAWSTVDLVVSTLRAHVSDFVQKPWDNHTLISVICREIESARKRSASHLAELSEFQEAGLIQRHLLPASLPSVPGWELAAAWQAARGITGDCFQAIRLDDTNIGICIADVAGKGIPAALMMSSVHTAVRLMAPQYRQPYELCAALNRMIYESTPEDRFITFFYGVLDTSARRLTYTNAGHNAPFVIRCDGSLGRLSTGGLPLGLFEEMSYEQGVMSLAQGDQVVLFTDGITEARTRSDGEFGEEGLVAAFKGCKTRRATEVRDCIMKQLTWSCGSALHDDAAVLVLGSH